MELESTPVVKVATAALVGEEVLPLTAHFTYLAEDPMAVTMTLVLDVELGCGHVAEAETTWMFARELLDAALSRPGETAGEGDVQMVMPDGEKCLQIDLTAVDDTRHRVVVDGGPVADFLADTFALVPAARESAVMDNLISRLLETR